MTPRGNRGEKVRNQRAGVDSSSRPDGLLSAALAGDGAARESLLQSHMQTVVATARARAGGSLGVEDLVQEGCLALWDAMQAFGDRPASEFEAYANEVVSRRMDEALASEQAAQRQAAELVAAADSYDEAEYRLAAELRRPPTSHELAQRLGWSLERTDLVAELVVEARRRHDEELAQYLEPAQPEPTLEAGNGRHGRG